ncbi:ABC transporter permease [Lederbergia sp. NSJ-179]|uniref:ABC transporter permease n=1 Tax=Lederbergia sp. NSJ-179 TaxID=2931402 RepID=UPI001FD322AB|nr:ABC transporter permease [Lederbergia sp. NSJ-179]MCJ7840020.1 ABC transporter permease [Lederbergia sp. NSJ-179]
MIRLICQSMINKKSKFLLLMVQFTIGFAALLFGLSCIFNLLQYKKSIEELAPLDTVHAYINEDDSLLEKNINMFNEYNNIFKKLKEKNLVENLGLFETMYVYDSTQETKNESRLYILNNDSIEMSNLTLQEGTTKPLETDIHSLNNIPVVVSAAMKDQYRLGKTYQLYYMNGHTDEYEKITIRVVGILASSVHFWPGGSTYISENIMANKEFILAPQFKDFEKAITFAFNSLFQLPEHNTREANLEQIQLLFEDHDLDLQYTTLRDEIDSYNKAQKVFIIGTITLAAILLLLSLLGCIGAILASITTRYKEFGIYYSLGFTKTNMIRLVYGEIIAVFGISFIIATVICKILFATLLVNEALTMNLSVIAIAFVIMIICIMLSTIMPFIKLKKIEPIEMIIGVNR